MFSNRRIFSMNAWYNERGDTTAVSCCDTFIVKNPCAALEKLIQYPRFTIQVHMVYNSPCHTIYNAHTDYNPGIRFTTPIQFTIWKTIGFCCFKKQQKCDFCRENHHGTMCVTQKDESHECHLRDAGLVLSTFAWLYMSFLLFRLFITIFIYILNYVLIVTFWIFTYVEISIC